LRTIIFLAQSGVLLAVFIGMEAFAWAMHRYVMHGSLWCWHESHHTRHDDVFELNDLFAVVFAAPAIACLWMGTHGLPWLMPVGLGITAYGLVYFIFHDGLVHRRFPVPLKRNSAFWRSRIQAHRLHHAVATKTGCVSFGFLWVKPIRTLKAKLVAIGVARGAA
jgi:beta-carotene 3-hydroxylase